MVAALVMVLGAALGLAAPNASLHRLEGGFGRKQGLESTLHDVQQQAPAKLIGNLYFPDDGAYVLQSNIRVKSLLAEQGRVLVDCLGWMHNIFEKAGIHYTAMYGTLLGVHRHNGIIPWTSDADLVIARVSARRDATKCSCVLCRRTLKSYGSSVKAS